MRKEGGGRESRRRGRRMLEGRKEEGRQVWCKRCMKGEVVCSEDRKEKEGGAGKGVGEREG